MDREVAATIAAKLKEAADTIGEVTGYIEFAERAPYARAVGEILAILSGEIFARLVRVDPELHELLFRDLPREYPEFLLRHSRYPVQPKASEGE